MLWFHLQNAEKNEFNKKLEIELRATIFKIMEDDPTIKASILFNFNNYYIVGKVRTPDFVLNNNLFLIQIIFLI